MIPGVDADGSSIVERRARPLARIARCPHTERERYQQI
jgi:hypothetical protein